jgi:hypothetical protein
MVQIFLSHIVEQIKKQYPKDIILFNLDSFIKVLSLVKYKKYKHYRPRIKELRTIYNLDTFKGEKKILNFYNRVRWDKIKE